MTFHGTEREKMMANLEVFSEAFSANWGTIALECDCGLNYYEDDRVDDLETGEYASLKSDPNARCVDYISVLSFEGRDYVECCNCWKPRAEQIMKFIDGHSHKIANYLTKEKRRVLDEAKSMPEVKAE